MSIIQPEWNVSALADGDCPPFQFDAACAADKGFIGAYIEHAVKRGDYLYFPAIIAGALTLTAHMAGRNWILQRPGRGIIRPNFYALVLGPSTIGKNLPLSINADVIDGVIARRQNTNKFPPVNGITNEFASREGLEDFIFHCDGNVLWEMDEAAELLCVAKQDAVAKAFRRFLLNLYTVKRLTPRQMATRNRQPEKTPQPIEWPNLTILADTVPDKFFGSLDQYAQTDGLLNRFVVFTQDNVLKSRNAKQNGENTPPDSMLEMAEKIMFPHSEMLQALEPNSEIVRPTDDADRLLTAIQDQYDVLYNKIAKAEQPLVGRAASEIIPKIALLYAVSERRHELTVADVRRAEQIVYTAIGTLLKAVRCPQSNEDMVRNAECIERHLKEKEYWLWSDFTQRYHREIKGTRAGYGDTKIMQQICESFVEQDRAFWIKTTPENFKDGKLVPGARGTVYSTDEKPKGRGVIIAWGALPQQAAAKASTQTVNTAEKRKAPWQ